MPSADFLLWVTRSGDGLVVLKVFTLKNILALPAQSGIFKRKKLLVTLGLFIVMYKAIVPWGPLFGAPASNMYRCTRAHSWASASSHSETSFQLTVFLLQWWESTRLPAVEFLLEIHKHNLLTLMTTVCPGTMYTMFQGCACWPTVLTEPFHLNASASRPWCCSLRLRNSLYFPVWNHNYIWSILDSILWCYPFC